VRVPVRDGVRETDVERVIDPVRLIVGDEELEKVGVRDEERERELLLLIVGEGEDVLDISFNDCDLVAVGESDPARVDVLEGV
jgi:hypothetical protein